MQQMPWFIPILVCLARVCDVSINTFRTILMLSGRKWLAGALGFVEVTIWVVAVGGVLKYISLANWTAVAAYSLGFAAGVVLGMTIEDRVALGYRMVRIVNPDGKDEGTMVSERLRQEGFRVTQVEGKGRSGPVEVAFTVVKRKSVESVKRVVTEHAPRSFVTVESVAPSAGGSWEDVHHRRWASGVLTQLRK
ncbi:MAG: DUF2179 domain-containing protein [Phycisphaerales bacterium]